MSRVDDIEGTGEVAERLKARRGGRLRPIDRVLLNSPALADGWNTFLGVLRGSLALPGPLRELVILRIAVLNAASYEWDSHLAVARAQGLSEDKIAALHGDPASGPFAPEETLVLALTDDMTRHVEAPAGVFDALLDRFGDRVMVELVATIAAYNMVSRFAVALEIREEGSTS